MAQYTLNVGFDNRSLDAIYRAGQQVTLVKQLPHSQPVAWVTFDPLNKNTITWTENYAIYASTTQTQAGAVIDELSDIMAVDANSYPFVNGHFQNGQSGIVGTGEYGIQNRATQFDMLTFGLAQGISVNGVAKPNQPINAQSVLKMQNAVFTPFENVMIYLHAHVESSMIVTDVEGFATTLTFGGSQIVNNVQYDMDAGKFSILS